MLIFLYGEDTYRSRKKLNEIVRKYAAKHKSGLNFNRIELKENNFGLLKRSIETGSMFSEKKLIIIEGALKQDAAFQKELLEYLEKLNLPKNEDLIIVFYEREKADKRTALFKFLGNKKFLVEEFSPLSGCRLENWIKKEIADGGGKIETAAIKTLIDFLEGDLWRITAEAEKLIVFKGGKVITKKDVNLFVRPKINTNIFNTIDALARRDKKTALRLLHQHLDEGVNEIYLLTMFIYQFRNLLVVGDLTKRGCNYFQISKKTKLHPFVIKKSLGQVKNFNLEGVKKIYSHLFNLDLAIKTGRIDPRTALDMLIMGI